MHRLKRVRDIFCILKDTFAKNVDSADTVSAQSLTTRTPCRRSSLFMKTKKFAKLFQPFHKGHRYFFFSGRHFPYKGYSRNFYLGTNLSEYRTNVKILASILNSCALFANDIGSFVCKSTHTPKLSVSPQKRYYLTEQTKLIMICSLAKLQAM